MAENAPGRSTSERQPRRLSSLVMVVLLGALGLGLASPAHGQTGPATSSVDVPRFSARAAAWSAANQVHREAATERAIALGEQAAEAEAEAEAEAARQAALAAAAATTTTAPPTTTTAAPTTTAPVTTTSAPEPAADADPATDPPATTTAPPAAPGGPTPEQWDALRQCESGGRYDALSPNGRYRGAYQFSQATWDWIAGVANPALVGVDPAAAAPADQDAMAQALYDRLGAGPWPHCGAYLS